jgi:hypothetical protein
LIFLIISPHRHAGHRVEAGGRLVEEEDLRLVHQAAGDLDAAPHAAGEIHHLFVAPLGEVHGFEQLVDQLLALRARHAVELREDDQVLFDAQLGVARHRLRDHADGAAHAVGLLGDVESADAGHAAGRRQQRRQHADQRRLAGAVRSEQAEDFALLHVNDTPSTAVKSPKRLRMSTTSMASMGLGWTALGS